MANNADNKDNNHYVVQQLFQANLPTTLIAENGVWLKINSDDCEKVNRKTCDEGKALDVPVIKFSSESELSFNETDDENSDTDIISDYIGHYGWWQFYWTFLLGLFQCPSTFQIFVFVFQVSLILLLLIIIGYIY